MLFESEISPGLVMVFDTRVLAEAVGETQVAIHAAFGAQFFLCVWTTRRRGGWVPCFHKPAPGREEVPIESRSGPDEWIACPCFMDPAFVINVRHETAVRAARRDPTHPGLRNRINPHLF